MPQISSQDSAPKMKCLTKGSKTLDCNGIAEPVANNDYLIQLTAANYAKTKILRENSSVAKIAYRSNSL